jgi:hypothetical protein
MDTRFQETLQQAKSASFIFTGMVEKKGFLFILQILF